MAELKKPGPPEAPQRGGSFIPLFLASLLVIVFVAVLSLLTMGYFGVILAVVLFLIAFVMLHYLVWGWWLGQMIRDEVEREERGDEAT